MDLMESQNVSSNQARSPQQQHAGLPVRTERLYLRGIALVALAVVGLLLQLGVPILATDTESGRHTATWMELWDSQALNYERRLLLMPLVAFAVLLNAGLLLAFQAFQRDA